MCFLDPARQLSARASRNILPLPPNSRTQIFQAQQTCPPENSPSAAKPSNSTPPADLEKHIQPLVESQDVEEIHLEGNTIGVEASEALAKVLATKQTLEFANLADIFTGRLLAEIPKALDALLTALLKCPQLRTVNLNDNAFGLNTVEPLRPFLSQHTPLQHLYLNNNGLGPSAGSLVAEALAQLAEKKAQARKEGKDVPDLETVVCGRNRLETGSMAAWVKAYQANDKVKMREGWCRTGSDKRASRCFSSRV